MGAASDEESESYLGSLVKKKDERKLISSSEYGEISGISVRERTDLSYHLQFITLKPFALFLPVVLHANMVFYVQTGKQNKSLEFIQLNLHCMSQSLKGLVLLLIFGALLSYYILVCETWDEVIQIQQAMNSEFLFFPTILKSWPKTLP